MIIAAIIACEIGFWVVLAAGLLVRYVLHRPRVGGWLLVGVPLVDLTLLLLTVLDLRRGSVAEPAHGLAAIYLGFSVVFGHGLVRWADAFVARRWAGGPGPVAKPRPGTWARARREWREWGQGVLAVALSAVLLLGATALVASAGSTTPLWSFFPGLGVVLVVWLVAWPAWETARAATADLRRAG